MPSKWLSRGDYALALKGNQGTLHDDVRLFLDDPTTPAAYATQISKGHGRIETRIASVSTRILDQSGGLVAGVAGLGQSNGNPPQRRRCQRGNRLRWIVDVTGNEDQARNRKGHGAENLALLRKLALNLARLEPSKVSMRGKLKKAGWDDHFLTNILSQFANIHMR